MQRLLSRRRFFSASVSFPSLPNLDDKSSLGLDDEDPECPDLLLLEEEVDALLLLLFDDALPLFFFPECWLEELLEEDDEAWGLSEFAFGRSEAGFSRAISLLRSQYLASQSWALFLMPMRVVGFPSPRQISSLRRGGRPS